MLRCSIRFSAPSLWMGGGLESRCLGRVYDADDAVRLVASNWHFTLFHEEDARSKNPHTLNVRSVSTFLSCHVHQIQYS